MGLPSATRGVKWKIALVGAVAVMMPFSLLGPVSDAGALGILPVTTRYIVSDSSAGDSSLARAEVLSVGGLLGQTLDAASAVTADLTPVQVAVLDSLPGVTLTPDVMVSLASTTTTTASSTTRTPAAVFPQQSGATRLWAQGNSGAGVNVAVLDTGIANLPDFAGRLQPGVDLSGEGNPTKDSYGHGTFVAGLIAGDGTSSNGLYKGEAPAAGLVPVKVAGASGQTDLATVIAGVGWVIAHHTTNHIGVLNMSLGYIPTTSTLVNPLDQAVERAWEAGVAVVVAAGNSGPFNGTILSPGDDPKVITVGSVDDKGAVSAAGNTMATFSSVGPTDPDGWFKPDLVTSGQSVVSLRAPGSTIDTQNPTAVVGTANFVGSGTSFSTAVTSGAIALLLADHSGSRPDDIKAALLGTADRGPVGNPFVDGHGLLDIAGADTANTHLTQSAGTLNATQPTPGTSTPIPPGTTVQAGYSIQVGGAHPALTGWLAGGQVNVPMACTANGPIVGFLTIDIPETSYLIPLASPAAVPATGTLQASASAPDLCEGAIMYPTAANSAKVAFTGSLISTDTTDPISVAWSYTYGPGQKPTNGPKTTVTGIGVTQAGATIDLAASWAQSSWNGSHWSGLKTAAATTSSAAVATGTTWDGSHWSGSTWSGSAWSGSHWSGSTWSGSHWSGSAWDGSTWSGSHWSGSHWSGSAWGPNAGDTTPPATLPIIGAATYPSYQLVATNPNLWCPAAVKLGTPGHAGNPSTATNAGKPGTGGTAGCGSDGGNGGSPGSGDTRGGKGGNGGNGGNGGCAPVTDTQMTAGQYPCNGAGSNGGNGGNGGNSNSGFNGGVGGTGGNGGSTQNAAGGQAGNGGPATSSHIGASGGTGGNGGGCRLYANSYWVTCPSSAGRGGRGGNGTTLVGGNGGNGGAAGTALNTQGGSGADATNATNTTPGTNGHDGTSGGTTNGATGTNG